MSELILRAAPRTQPLMYTFDGAPLDRLEAMSMDARKCSGKIQVLLTIVGQPNKAHIVLFMFS